MSILSRIFGGAGAPRDLGDWQTRSLQAVAAGSARADAPSSLRALQHDGPLLLKSLLGDSDARGALPPALREMNDKMMRMFESGFSDAYSADLIGTYADANSEIVAYDYRSIANARSVCGNRPQPKAALRTIMNNVVGDRGFRLDMRLGKWQGDKFVLEEETNRMLESHYILAGLPKNFDAKQQWSRNAAFRVMAGAAWRDGRCLLRRYRGYPYNPYGYAVKILEQDRVQSNYTGTSPVTGYPIRCSIERHPDFDFPVAYWVLSRHPGSSYGYWGKQTNTYRERIEAEDMVMLNNLMERAEQEIGFTEMDSIIRVVHQNAQYSRALTLAAIATCFKPFWIKKNFPTGMQYNADEFSAYMTNLVSQVTGPLGPGGGAGASANTLARQQGLTAPTDPGRPAETKLMNWGEELMQVSNEFPSEAGHNFRADNDHEAAVGAGVSYSEWSGRFDNMGFMAARMSRQPSQLNYRVRQAETIDTLVRPEFEQQLRSGIMTGEIPFPMNRLKEAVAAATFKGPTWESANPLADMQTLVLAMQNGILTPQQVQNALPDGMSVEDVCAAWESYNDLLERHDLHFGDPGGTTKPTTPEPEPPEEDTPGTDDGTTKAPAKKKPQLPRGYSRNGHRGVSSETLAILSLQETDGRNGGRH